LGSAHQRWLAKKENARGGENDSQLKGEPGLAVLQKVLIRGVVQEPVGKGGVGVSRRDRQGGSSKDCDIEGVSVPVEENSAFMGMLKGLPYPGYRRTK